jgi:hypothetical protein
MSLPTMLSMVMKQVNAKNKIYESNKKIIMANPKKE